MHLWKGVSDIADYGGNPVIATLMELYFEVYIYTYRLMCLYSRSPSVAR